VIKKLYTIGDSWTYGDELENPETECYPYLLSQEFNCELINKAICGGSNDWMFRKTIEWVCSQENLDGVAIIVGWSSVNRREENYKIYHGAYQDDVIDKFIFTKILNMELEHYKSICYMISLQEFLNSKNVKYLFYQPWYDILDCEKKLLRDRQQQERMNHKGWWNGVTDDYDKSCYTEELTIGKIIDKVDKKYLVGPLVDDVERIMSGIYGRIHDGFPKMHPNKNDHKVMCEFIKEKLMELYS
jgi:hypothetical protein